MITTSSATEHETERNAKAVPSASDDPRAMRTRIIVFAIVIPAILLIANWFTCVTWNHFHAQSGMLPWQFVLMLLPVSFVPATVLGLQRSNVLLRFWYRVSAASLGVLSFSLVAALGCWIIYAIAALSGMHLDPRILATAFFSLGALASGYGMVNSAWVRVTRVTVKLPGLPETWHGRTAAFVSDLHLGNLRGAAFARRIVTKLQSLRPDIVFISGDMFDGTTSGLDGLVEPWSSLSVPAGVYYVTGNHEEFGDRAKYTKAVARTGIHVLNNEMVTVDGLQVIGVHDGEASDPDVLREVLNSAKLDPKRTSVLLAHQPANLAVADSAGISLQLSGHTHAGQFWPWSWLISRAHGRFSYGLNCWGNLQVLTSSGAGTWGPPLRVGTRSEIVLLRFERRSQT